MLNQASKARNWKKWGTWPRLWLCRATCRWCRALCGLWSGRNVQSKTCDIIYDESETIWTFVPPHPKNMIPFNPQLAKAPAATLRSFSQAAGADLGQVTAKPTKQNASRDAHRFVCNWGLSWKVPLSEFKYVDSNNQEHVISYISPISYMTFLVEKAPELLMGGVQDLKQGCRQLGSFWQNYKKLHPTHRLFQDAHPSRTTSNTFAMCFHGDEGRGKKKGNTAVLMMETCLGVNTAENIKLKKKYDDCKECVLRDRCAKRFKTYTGTCKESEVQRDPEPCAFQGHNTKLNSFLTKFVLAVLPHELYKNSNLLELIIEQFCKDFKALFDLGFVAGNKQWYMAMTGLKGDLKWYEKIANLTRCFNKQIGHGLHMCHECMAGAPDLPFEDASHFPCWGDRLFEERPWEVEPSISTIPFEPEDGTGCPEMILRRDFFIPSSTTQAPSRLDIRTPGLGLRWYSCGKPPIARRKSSDTHVHGSKIISQTLCFFVIINGNRWWYVRSL